MRHVRRCSSGRAVIVAIVIITLASSAGAGQKPDTTPADAKPDLNDPNRYLNAVREFADNVLKYGRDTYGPKHTPLFVDGLMVRDPNDPNYGKDGIFKPVKWIDPDGYKWVLSNLASQQNLFRTLDGLTAITGDPKYKQAAMDAIEYAFENLRSPNGLLYWGNSTAYDAGGEKVVGWHIGEGCVHHLKANLPYYELMWQVNPKATKAFIESFWSAHVIDWSNLAMNRIGQFHEELEQAWRHEYKGGPVFFESSSGGSFLNTGIDLVYAAVSLTKLSGDREPSVWARRLIKRYVDTRHPNTGISYLMYTKPPIVVHQSYDDVLSKLVPGTTEFLPDKFPSSCNPIYYKCNVGYMIPTPGISIHSRAFFWQSLFLVGEMLGREGDEFKRWALEELTAFGKASYRKKDNVYVPILTDGTNLEGYFVKEDGPLGPKGVTLESCPVRPSDLWSYTMAYRVTRDKFMWEMTNSIARGNDFGDIGITPEDRPQLNLDTGCSDPYALLAFLELYKATEEKGFLEIATKIGHNVLDKRFHKGFFVASNKHIYTKFDAIDSFVLLHLYSALVQKAPIIPEAWPGRSFFQSLYREKLNVIDNQIIYTLTESVEPPVSLNEGAAIGNLDLVKSLIVSGADVNNREDVTFRTPLHRAAMSGHKDIAVLLLENGADINAGSNDMSTALHHAVGYGHKDVAELLIAKGADVNAEDTFGYPPLQHAVLLGHIHRDIIELLLEKGAKISTIYLAAYMGDLAKVEAFIQEGVDINICSRYGNTSLHYAAKNNQSKKVIELLLANGADVNVKNEAGDSPLHSAVRAGHKDIAELLIGNGADVKAKNTAGDTPLHLATKAGRKDVVELFLANGADVNAKNSQGQAPLDIAAARNRKDIVDLLIAKGADVSSIHIAAGVGDVARVRAFLEQGTDVNAKDKDGQTALHVAVVNKQKDIAELLIGRGADVNAKGRDGYTPLFYAIWTNDANMVELLASRGADTSYTPEKSYPPLHWAVWQEHLEIVKALMDHGAKWDVKDQDGWTAFRYAASASNRDLVDLFLARGADVSGMHLAACVGDLTRVRRLAEEGADVNAQDELGWTPLYWAASMGREDVGEFLLGKGARADIRTKEERTALHQAAYAGSVRLVELLIPKGVDVNAIDKSGSTPLHGVAWAGHQEVAKLLIAKGADVNARRTNGRTPLHRAAMAGHKEVVEVLLANGADVTLKDSRGSTAYDWAKQRGHTEIVELLQRHGAEDPH